ncbi:hypothetical protein GGR54DRAFT_482168 [Hypoxylon sp. NC1633]|nr:hypothetical protein GGR54DRAFT_482168 [Hypoxylon sp. NC1633]
MYFFKTLRSLALRLVVVRRAWRPVLLSGNALQGQQGLHCMYRDSRDSRDRRESLTKYHGRSSHQPAPPLRLFPPFD